MIGERCVFVSKPTSRECVLVSTGESKQHKEKNWIKTQVNVLTIKLLS